MRIRNKTNFTIKHINLGNDLKTVRDNLSKIDFINDDADIIILDSQPGTGKSTAVRNFCKSHQDISRIIFTARHNLINEYHSIPNFQHWEGFSRLCQRLDDPEIKNLKEYWGIDSRYCKIIGCSDCPYPTQFLNPDDVEKKVRMVLSPNNYLYTPFIKDFDIIFVDEQLDAYQEIDCNPFLDEFDESKYIHFPESKNWKSLNRAIAQRDFKWIEKHFNQINAFQYSILDEAIECGDLQTVREILRFNLNIIIESFKYAHLYPNDYKNQYGNIKWYKPYLYYLFKLCQTSKVVMTCATFNEKFFIDMLEFYSGEFGFERPIKIKVYDSNINNKNTIVARVGDGWYPNSLPKNINLHLEALVSELGSANIGIVCNKEHSKESGDKTVYKGTEIECNTYGNSAGNNNLQDKPVLVAIGSYVTNLSGLEYNYNRLYKDNLKIKEVIENGGEQIYYKRKLINKDKYPELHNYQNIKDICEMYDAFHRSRGLLSPKYIICFADVPDKIEEEFNYQLYTDNPKLWLDIDDILKQMGLNINKVNNVNMPLLMEIANKITPDLAAGLSDTEICKKHHIYDGKNLAIYKVKAIRSFCI